jgi:hypothetical protein
LPRCPAQPCHADIVPRQPLRDHTSLRPQTTHSRLISEEKPLLSNSLRKSEPVNQAASATSRRIMPLSEK